MPEHQFSLWNRFAFNANWAAGLGIIAQSDMYATLDNRVKLPGYARVDAALYYAFANGKTRLALNVENLFDAEYYPTADGNNNISPGAPRNARVTLITAF